MTAAKSYNTRGWFHRCEGAVVDRTTRADSDFGGGHFSTPEKCGGRYGECTPGGSGEDCALCAGCITLSRKEGAKDMDELIRTLAVFGRPFPRGGNSYAPRRSSVSGSVRLSHIRPNRSRSARRSGSLTLAASDKHSHALARYPYNLYWSFRYPYDNRPFSSVSHQLSAALDPCYPRSDRRAGPLVADARWIERSGQGGLAGPIRTRSRLSRLHGWWSRERGFGDHLCRSKLGRVPSVPRLVVGV